MIEKMPETMKHPRMLLWTALLPQLLLLLLNWRAWGIVHGEMNPEQLQRAMQLGACEAALLIGIAVLIAIGYRLKRQVGLFACAGILLAGIAYLWFFTASAARIMPSTIADWMLPGSQIIYYQYALIMPALFYAGVRLACFPARIPKAADIGGSLLLFIAVPAAWYIGTRLLDMFWRFADPAVYVILTFAVGSTIILLIAFLRLLTYAYLALATVSWGRPVMLFVAGLIAPIGGLMLNRTIPFPYDFQAQSVYVLTCLNALFLLLPFTGSTRRNTLVWSLRCATYPFSLYFFLVFLPFLPLSLPAMIAGGAGFLILAPTLLFILHTRTLAEEARALRVSLGTTRIMLTFALCVALLPAALAGRALIDKQALTQALDAAYRPDYASGRISVNRTALRRTLQRLHDVKHGVYLPFITDGYDAIVLDGMILPDRKIDFLETLFFGQSVKRNRPTSMFSDVFNPAAQRRHARHQNRVRLPPRNVQLTGTERHTTVSAATPTTTLVLTLQNDNNEGAEFVTDITLPDGVFITGYWLNIGENRVPGRIVDKKAAMWVYHMIRDQTRRDPGMLTTNADGTVHLNVFPFAAGETRITAIAFSYPTGLSPRVQIGGTAVDMEPGFAESNLVFQSTDADTTAILIPAATAAALPAVTRQPYLHLIVDCSEQAASARTGFGELINRVIAQIPEIGDCRITLANYEFKHLTPALIPLTTAADMIAAYRKTIPFRGAFCPERAIKSALLQTRDNPGLLGHVPMVPIFVVIKADGSALLREADGFGPFADLTPDVDAYYVTRGDGQFDTCSFHDQTTGTRPAIPAPAPVIVLQAGTVHAVCATDRASVVRIPAGDVVDYYNPTQGQYAPLPNPKKLAPDGRPAQALALMQDWKQTRYQPATAEGKRRDLLARSRQHGILIPETAYIVVENPAQWDMLDRAEAKSLKADSKLEFDEFIESPAPPMLLLLPVVFLLPVVRRRGRKSF